MSKELNKMRAEAGRLGGLAGRGVPKKMSKRAKRAKALKAWSTRRRCTENKRVDPSAIAACSAASGSKQVILLHLSNK